MNYPKIFSLKISLLITTKKISTMETSNCPFMPISLYTLIIIKVAYAYIRFCLLFDIGKYTKQVNNKSAVLEK